MNKTAVIGAVLGLLVLPPGLGFALADTAKAEPTPSVSQPTVSVLPRDLMTFGERFALLRKLRAAKTADERFDLWAENYAELEKRASERGVVLRDYGPMMMMMDHGPTAQRSGRRSRVGMLPPVGNTVRPRAPMAW